MKIENRHTRLKSLSLLSGDWIMNDLIIMVDCFSNGNIVNVV